MTYFRGFLLITSVALCGCIESSHFQSQRSPSSEVTEALESVKKNPERVQACVNEYRAERKKDGKKRKQRQGRAPAFVEVPAKKVKKNPFVKYGNLKRFIKALDRRIKRCDPKRVAKVSRRTRNLLFKKATFAGKPYNSREYCYKTSIRLKKLAKQSATMEAFYRKVKNQFRFFTNKLPSHCKSSKHGPAHFTSYYNPTLLASKTKSGEYKHPIYGVPKSRKMRRLTRAEIYKATARGKMQKATPIFGYAKSPFDLFIAQVQGSTVVQFVNPNSGRPLTGTGSKLQIGYGAANKKPYVSLGRVMKCMGLENTSVPGLKAFFEKRPDLLIPYLSTNPSWIFFTRTRQGATGSFGLPVEGHHSVAINPKSFPYGAVGFISGGQLPTPGSAEKKPFSSFVLIDDTGGAIKGDACSVRVDYYAGNGPEASHIAGNMNDDNANIYLLLPKKL